MSYKLNIFTGTLDIVGGGSSSIYWLDAVALPTDLTLGDPNGSARIVRSTDTVFIFDGDTSKWINSGLSADAFSATAEANGISIVSTTAGDITSQKIKLHKASATTPGGVSIDAQTFAGDKTFQDKVIADGGIDITATAGVDNLNIGITNANKITLGKVGVPVFVPDTLTTNNIDCELTGGSNAISIGSTVAETINIGRPSALVNIYGTANIIQSTDLQVFDKLITLNVNGVDASGGGSGVEIEENGSIPGYNKVSGDRNSWVIKAPNTAGIAAITPGASGITLDQSSHNPVTVVDSNSIDFTLSTQQVSADVILSGNAADSGNTKVALDIQSTGSVGVRAQILNSDIQSLIGITDTNSVDLTYSSGNISADVRLSPEVADTGYTKVDLDIQSGSPGIRAQLIHAGSGADGALTSTDWTTFNNKLTPNAPITPGTHTKITYDANGLVTSGTSTSLLDLNDISAASPSVNDVLTWNGIDWINTTLPIGQGNGVSFFFDNTASDIPTYKIINTVPVDLVESDNFVDVTVGTSPVAIEEYASPVIGLGDTQIEAGVWVFNIWANASIGGTCTVQMDVFKRSALGVETALFTVNTPLLTTINTLYPIQVVQPAYAITATDRLVIKTSATNTSATSTTVHYYHSGTAHYSNVKTPLIQRHNDLAGLQGGSSTERYHLDSSQHVIATQAASGSVSGYLSSGDWTTFNNKQTPITGDLNSTFTLTNNQSSPADITGFAFANGSIRAFDALVSVYINATSGLYEVIKIQGIQKGSSWEMSQHVVGDVSGVVFTITSAGQLQYTSSNVVGFVSGTIKFRALTLPV